MIAEKEKAIQELNEYLQETEAQLQVEALASVYDGNKEVIKAIKDQIKEEETALADLYGGDLSELAPKAEVLSKDHGPNSQKTKQQ